MKSGDLSTGPAKLHKAWQNLLVRWEHTKLGWHDPVSQQFEEEYLAAFGEQIQATLERMRALSSIFNTVEHDCNRQP